MTLIPCTCQEEHGSQHRAAPRSLPSKILCLLYTIPWWLNAKSLRVPCPSQGRGSEGRHLWAWTFTVEQDRVGMSLLGPFQRGLSAGHTPTCWEEQWGQERHTPGLKVHREDRDTHTGAMQGRTCHALRGQARSARGRAGRRAFQEQGTGEGEEGQGPQELPGCSRNQTRPRQLRDTGSSPGSLQDGGYEDRPEASLGRDG